LRAEPRTYLNKVLGTFKQVLYIGDRAIYGSPN